MSNGVNDPDQFKKVGEEFRNELLDLLQDIRKIVTSQPLEEALSDERNIELNIILKQSWDKWIKLSIQNSLANMQRTEVEALISLLNFNNLEKMNFDDLTTEIDTLIANTRNKITDFQRKKLESNKTIAKQELVELETSLNHQMRFLQALESGKSQLSKLNNNINFTQKHQTPQNTTEYIFPAAGAFLGGTLAVMFGLASTVALGFVGGISIWLGIGLIVGAARRLGSTFLGEKRINDLAKKIFDKNDEWLETQQKISTHSHIENAMNLGEHLGKRASNDMYFNKTNLLYNISHLEQTLLDQPNKNTIKNSMDMMLNYYSVLDQTKIVHHKLSGIQLLKAISPKTEQDLRLHFKNRIEEISKSIEKATQDLTIRVVDIKTIKDLEHILHDIEKDWAAIMEPLAKNDIHGFCTAVNEYLHKFENKLTTTIETTSPQQEQAGNKMIQKRTLLYYLQPADKNITHEKQEIQALREQISHIKNQVK